MDMYTLLYLKWIINMDLLDRQGTLLNVLWQPRWEGIWGRIDTCIHMAESLHYSPEIITPLFVCLFFNYIYFKLEANYFTILWLVLPYIDLNPPQVYMCPPS